MILYTIILNGIFLLNLGMTNLPDPVVQPSITSPDLVDDLATKETKDLYKFLLEMGDSDQFLFGSHDQTAYGIDVNAKKWVDDGSGNRSDIKQITGSHGAIFSWDVSEVTNSDIPGLEAFRNRVKQAHEMGGITTFSWNMKAPMHQKQHSTAIKAEHSVKEMLKHGNNHEWYLNQLVELGEFFLSLKDTEGNLIPVVFRPFNQSNNNTYWWGKGNCYKADFDSLWKFTVEYLRDNLGVHNLVYAYSPEGSLLVSKEDYLETYPGDDYVDVFGMDYYFRDDCQLNNFATQLGWVIELANEHNKIMAITETGNKKLKVENWYTSMFLKGIEMNNFRISYSSVLSNSNLGHFYVPYPGQESVDDFVSFYSHPATVFLDGINR